MFYSQEACNASSNTGNGAEPSQSILDGNYMNPPNPASPSEGNNGKVFQHRHKNPCPLFSMSGDCLSRDGVIIPERFFEAPGVSEQGNTNSKENEKPVYYREVKGKLQKIPDDIQEHLQSMKRSAQVEKQKDETSVPDSITPALKRSLFQELKYNVFHALHQNDPLRYFVDPFEILYDSKSMKIIDRREKNYSISSIDKQDCHSSHSNSTSTTAAKSKKNKKHSSLLLECAARLREHGRRTAARRYQYGRNINMLVDGADDLLKMWNAEDCLLKMVEPMSLFACVKELDSLNRDRNEDAERGNYGDAEDFDGNVEDFTMSDYDELIEINDFDDLHKLILSGFIYKQANLANSLENANGPISTVTDSDRPITGPTEQDRMHMAEPRYALQALAVVWKRPEDFDLDKDVEKFLKEISLLQGDSDLSAADEASETETGQIFFRIFTSIHLLLKDDLEKILSVIFASEYQVVTSSETTIFFDTVFPMLTQCLLVSEKINECLRVKMPAWTPRSIMPASLQLKPSSARRGSSYQSTVVEVNCVTANLTLLDICCWLGMSARFKYLLDCGADPTVRGEFLEGVGDRMKRHAFDAPLTRALSGTDPKQNKSLTQSASHAEDLIQALRGNVKKNYLAGTILDKKKSKEDSYFCMTSDEDEDSDDEE